MVHVGAQLSEIKNHPALNSCEEVAEMILPRVQSYGVTVFNYYRIYFDGSVIRLSTDRAWTEHYFKKNYLNKLQVPIDYLTKPLNYYIWLTEDCPEILLDAALNFNTSNGMTIAWRHKDYMDYFCFATTRENVSIINTFYLRHLDLLLRISQDFKAQASVLLKRSEKNKLIITNDLHETAHNQFKLPKQSNGLNLTNRQLDCALLLLLGMSNKEIAQKLLLSPRTVETYINHLKLKFASSNRTELTVKLARFVHDVPV